MDFEWLDSHLTSEQSCGDIDWTTTITLNGAVVSGTSIFTTKSAVSPFVLGIQTDNFDDMGTYEITVEAKYTNFPSVSSSANFQV